MSRKMISRLVWLLLWVPLIYFGWRVLNQDLGAQPAKTLLTSLGTLSIRLFILNLYIGVALSLLRPFPRRLIWISFLRRPIGVMTFFYLALHFSFYFINEATLLPAWTQIFEKKYLGVAFLAWMILFALTLTSNDFSIRWLTPRIWRRIHRLVHISSLLIFLHILWIEKADLILALIYFIPLYSFQIVRLFRYFSRSK